jgi:hypothetical protein
MGVSCYAGTRLPSDLQLCLYKGGYKLDDICISSRVNTSVLPKIYCLTSTVHVRALKIGEGLNRLIFESYELHFELRKQLCGGLFALPRASQYIYIKYIAG